MRSWYKILAKAADAKQAVVSIFDEIGFWGVTASAFIADLRAAADGAEEIVVEINSPGGSVFDAVAIYSALRAHPAAVTVKVMGIAASAASYVAMAGDKIVMPSNAFLMVHNPMTFAFGNADELQDAVDGLRNVEASMTATYVKRSKKSEDEVKAILAKDTYLSAAEALEFGFCDEVTDEFRATAAFEVDRLPENVRAVFKAADPVEPEPVDPPEDEPVTVASLIVQITAQATEAGFADHAAAWAVSCTSLDAVQAAIAVARDTTDLCALVGAPEKAKQFIAKSTPVADVRVALAAHLADKAPVIDNAPPAPGVANQAPGTKAVKTADIWAKHRQNQRST